jgi:hypothetical protein
LSICRNTARNVRIPGIWVRKSTQLTQTEGKRTQFIVEVITKPAHTIDFVRIESFGASRRQISEQIYFAPFVRFRQVSK